MVDYWTACVSSRAQKKQSSGCLCATTKKPLHLLVSTTLRNIASHLQDVCALLKVLPIIHSTYVLHVHTTSVAAIATSGGAEPWVVEAWTNPGTPCSQYNGVDIVEILQCTSFTCSIRRDFRPTLVVHDRPIGVFATTRTDLQLSLTSHAASS